MLDLTRHLLPQRPPRPMAWPRALATGLSLVGLYVLSGEVGLALATYGGTVTLLWAPSGLALAALVVGGIRLWPAVWLGSFLTNGHLDPPLAVLIATGNTLEAVVGASLMERTGVDPGLSRVRDVLLFLAWSAVCPIVSASIGTAAVVLGDLDTSAHAARVWMVWWAGDTTGAITIAPALLTWSFAARSLAFRERRVEAVALATGTVLASVAGFGTVGAPSVAGVLATFPLIAWASLRFGARAASAILAWLTCAAIVGTALGRGPLLGDGGPNPVVAWIYLCGVGVMALLVTALVVERDAALDLLRDQARELREADRRKDEFLAMLGHELRNPLAAVAAGARVLGHPAATAPQRVWATQAIERQVTQLASLVDDLLDLTRISRGSIELRREVVHLREVVAHAERAVRPVMTERRHTFACHLSEEDLVLDADPTRLEQVLVNLLTNAAKYTPPGGRVVLAAERTEGRLQLSVSDTGAGMTATELEHAFEPFYQGRAGRGAGGLGLGLALIHQLVALHGGEVSAESEGLGRGSTFRVTLPLPTVEVTTPPLDRAIPSAGRAKGLRILVVDDNVDVATGLRLLLEEQGAEVVTAADGRSGIAAAERFAPHLALLDLGLPDLTGYEVARAIRCLPCSRDTTLVAVTGFGAESTRDAATEAGFSRVLVKPVDEGALLDLVEALAA